MSVTCRTILSDIQTVPGSVSFSTYFFLSVLTVAPPQEQKLVLQSRTKDGHLSQLGEVEKRFSALSRQCAVVKRAHDNLEQNGNRYRKTDIYIYIYLDVDHSRLTNDPMQTIICTNQITHFTYVPLQFVITECY